MVDAMKGIAGRVVVITGASSGIGSATAIMLAGKGAKVMLGARRQVRLEAICAQITEDGGEADFRVTDIKNEADTRALVEAAISKWGRIDVLLNNAADVSLSYLKDAKTKEWSDQIDTNIKGTLYMIAAALPRMLDQGDGHIVNVASTLSFTVMKTSAVYSATKFALQAIAEGIRIEAGPLQCAAP